MLPVLDPTFQNRRNILKDASGIFKPGELTAIMGPSGADTDSDTDYCYLSVLSISITIIAFQGLENLLL